MRPRHSIKNYRSEMPVEKIVSAIQSHLMRAKAKRISFDYADDGTLEAISFFVSTPKGDFPVMLPARVDKIAKILYDKPLSELPDSARKQSYTTAWANIRDWIDAQCALIETEMVKTEEVFLPYIEVGGQRFFEHLENKGFNQLAAGAPEEGEVIGGGD